MSGIPMHLLQAPPWVVYGLIALLVFAEDGFFLGFVLPGETVAVLGGVAASRGHASVVAVVAIVVAAAILGDVLGYEIGRHVGPRILRSRLLDRHRARLDQAASLLARRGGTAVFLGRWTAFLRAVTPALAGTVRMPYPRFLAFNAAGGLAWGTAVVLVGYLAGESYARVEQTVGRGVGLAALGTALLAAVVWRVRKRRGQRAASRLLEGDGSGSALEGGNQAAERVLIISASVGAGHDGAAEELGRRLERHGALVDRRDFLDALPGWIRFVLRTGYGPAVTYTPRFYHWLFVTLERPSWIRRASLLLPRLAARTVAGWTEGTSAVVSTYPLASQCVGLLVERGLLNVPTTTYLTDPAPHSLWVSPRIDRHLTVLHTTARLGEAYGVPMTAVGPLVPERFGGAMSAARRAELRAELGVRPEQPLALVVAGSLGLGRVRETADALTSTRLVVPLVLCGRNQRLLHQLRDRPGVLALGWRDDVHDLMTLCDVLVHNAGGMSFTESLVAGLPAVTYACITGHGRANGDVLARADIAPMAETVEELREALSQQLHADVRARVRASVPVDDRDAAAVVLADIRNGARRSMSPRPAATRPRRRGRRAAVVAVAAAVLATFGATDGVAAVTRHGLAVAQLPSGTASVVVRDPSLPRLVRLEVSLTHSSAAVMVPSTWTPANLRAARNLADAGVVLVGEPCRDVELLRHGERCDLEHVRQSLADRHVPLSSVLVAPGRIDAPDLLLAAEDSVRLLPANHVEHLADASIAPSSTNRGTELTRQVPPSGGVVVFDAATVPTATLSAKLEEFRNAAAARGLRLVPVTEAAHHEGRTDD